MRNHPISEISSEPVEKIKEDKKERLIVICDYLSSMTDRYAIEIAKNLLFPNPMPLND